MESARLEQNGQPSRLQLVKRMPVSEIPGQLIARAPRFTIRVPMTYRVLGERTWREATTINISKSGILFQAESLIEPGTRIEIRFTLPLKCPSPGGMPVSCRGKIVRAPGDFVLAAAISAPRISRRT